MRFLKYFLSVFVILLSFYVSTAFSATDYIYRQRLNWVKIIRASPSEVPLGKLKHPYVDITTDQMQAMLSSIKIAKRYVLKKEVHSADVFTPYEANLLAPHIIEGLGKVDPDHVLHISIIHKRPAFVMRNDHLSMGNVWVSDDGIHFQFTKLFAKLTGDYSESSNREKAVRKAKTRRISLEAQSGQKLSYDSPTEVILDPHHNFIDQVAREVVDEANQASGPEDVPEPKKKEQSSTELEAEGPQEANTEGETKTLDTPEPQIPQQDVSARLGELEGLREKGLISKQEYKQLRQKILSEI